MTTLIMRNKPKIRPKSQKAHIGQALFFIASKIVTAMNPETHQTCNGGNSHGERDGRARGVCVVCVYVCVCVCVLCVLCVWADLCYCCICDLLGIKVYIIMSFSHKSVCYLILKFDTLDNLM